jgi:hypothetical protein
MIGPGFWFRAVAVASQIHAHDMESFREPWRCRVPHHVRLRVSVQKEQGLSFSSVDEVDFCASGFDFGLLKIFTEHIAPASRFSGSDARLYFSEWNYFLSRTA